MLADKLSTLSEKAHGCKVNFLVKSLDKKDAEALVGAIKNPNLSARGISGALASEGFSIGRDSILKSRTCLLNPNMCKCGLFAEEGK